MIGRYVGRLTVRSVRGILDRYRVDISTEVSPAKSVDTPYKTQDPRNVMFLPALGGHSCDGHHVNAPTRAQCCRRRVEGLLTPSIEIISFHNDNFPNFQCITPTEPSHGNLSSPDSPPPPPFLSLIQVSQFSEVLVVYVQVEGFRF